MVRNHRTGDFALHFVVNSPTLAAGVYGDRAGNGDQSSGATVSAIGFLDAPWKVIAVLLLYLVIQNIESYWLTPTVMANQVSLLPAITLTCQLFFTAAFGALGLVMALPLTVVAKVWIEEALFKDILDQWRHSSS